MVEPRVHSVGVSEPGSEPFRSQQIIVTNNYVKCTHHYHFREYNDPKHIIGRDNNICHMHAYKCI